METNSDSASVYEVDLGETETKSRPHSLEPDVKEFAEKYTFKGSKNDIVVNGIKEIRDKLERGFDQKKHAKLMNEQIQLMKQGILPSVKQPKYKLSLPKLKQVSVKNDKESIVKSILSKNTKLESQMTNHFHSMNTSHSKARNSPRNKKRGTRDHEKIIKGVIDLQLKEPFHHVSSSSSNDFSRDDMSLSTIERIEKKEHKTINRKHSVNQFSQKLSKQQTGTQATK